MPEPRWGPTRVNISVIVIRVEEVTNTPLALISKHISLFESSINDIFNHNELVLSPCIVSSGNITTGLTIGGSPTPGHWRLRVDHLKVLKASDLL
jgi:hypothetical protein